MNYKLTQDMINDYMNGMIWHDLQQKYGISATQLRRLLAEKEILYKRPIHRRFNYNREPYISIKNDYVNNKLSIKQLMLKYNKSENGIFNFLRKFNLTRNPTEANELVILQNAIKYKNYTFFDNIDNEQKAYWLGFFVGDGNITKNRVNIGLAKKDEKHLQKFANIFGAKILNGINHDKRSNKDFPYVRVYLNCKYIVNSLTKLGICKNKAYRLDSNIFYNIPDQLKRHFLRGYFDADGTSRGDNLSFISCSDIFLQNIGNYITKVLDLPNYHIYKYSNANKITITWCGKKYVSLIYDYFYNNANIYLERKELCIRKSKHNINRRWDPIEIQQLYNLININKYANKQLQVLFPGRTIRAIKAKWRRIYNDKRRT